MPVKAAMVLVAADLAAQVHAVAQPLEIVDPAVASRSALDRAAKVAVPAPPTAGSVAIHGVTAATAAPQVAPLKEPVHKVRVMAIRPTEIRHMAMDVQAAKAVLVRKDQVVPKAKAETDRRVLGGRRARAAIVHRAQVDRRARVKVVLVVDVRRDVAATAAAIADQLA